MEDNIAYVEKTTDLHEGAKDLVRRSIEMVELILGRKLSDEKIVHPGKKAQQLHIKE